MISIAPTELQGNEGPAHDATLQWGDSYYYSYESLFMVAPGTEMNTPSAFYGLKVPPGFALCGVVDFDEHYRDVDDPMALDAQGRIPSGIQPSTLTVAGYPPIDLTQPTSADLCKSTPKQPATTSTEVILGQEGSELYAKITVGKLSKTTEMESAPSLPIRIVTVNITNLNKFGDMTIDDLYGWAAYADGAWAALETEDSTLYGPFPSRCSDPLLFAAGYIPGVVAGPSQKVTMNFCFPPGNSHNKLIAFALSSRSNGFFDTVVLET